MNFINNFYMLVNYLRSKTHFDRMNKTIALMTIEEPLCFPLDEAWLD